MPDIACTLLVIFGFLAGALCLRILAGASAPKRVRVRVPRTANRSPRAMIRP
ncbi:hypothetical protein HLB23_22900 [Nocardia uniformis]|uniref:Uncharacterized protein n=1 Tax=Nocardia uniformis TaxID=53432 RepID=A0A849C8Q9_9NOCA|nr:hypothetical protein [Nocardia uniformis]NNH72675.1 hypothetical protein [Nocardia uniformis]